MFSSLINSATAPKEGTPKSADKSINDIYQETKKKADGEAGKEETKATTSSEKEKRSKILDIIEKNVNRKYFSEKKLDVFFEHCFSLSKPEAFVEEETRFNSFIQNDLKFIV